MRTKQGWLFSREVVDQTLLLGDGEEIRHNSETVNLWSDALAMLERNPWHKLYPLVAHSEFKQLIFDAVLARFKTENKADPRLLEWRELCDISDN